MGKHVDEARCDCQSFGVDDVSGSSATQIPDCGDSITLQPHVCCDWRTARSVINGAAFDNDVELLLRNCARRSLPVSDDCQCNDQRQSQELVQIVFHNWASIKIKAVS